MRKLILCLPLVIFGLMAYVPTVDAKPKKPKPPTPEEQTEAYFKAVLYKPEEHKHVTPGNISARSVPSLNGATFGIRRLSGAGVLPWPIYCAADDDDNFELTRKELTTFFKLEEKGQAPTPDAADFAYEARIEGLKDFMEKLKGDLDDDNKLSMAELGLGEDARDGFDAGDLNGDEALDIHEYPGWFALGMFKPEDDPFRIYRYEGSTWTYDFGAVQAIPGIQGGRDALTEEWKILKVTENSSFIEVVTKEGGKQSERVPPMYLRLWFTAGAKAWCLPDPKWKPKADPEMLDLPIGKVSATCWEEPDSRNPKQEYYSPEYPNLPVKFMRGGYSRSHEVATLSAIKLKLPKAAKKKDKDDNDAGADNAAKLAGVNIFLMLDKNQDGLITAREYLDGSKAYRDEQCKGKEEGVRAHMDAWISPHHFVFADKDDVEGLSREEFDEYRKRFERRGSYPSPRTISRQQLDRLSAILAEDELDRFDTDRDGNLTEGDAIAGESVSAHRRFHRSDLDGNGSVTKGELEEAHRARVLARAPDLASAKESDSGKHDWKLEDKNLNFALFQQVRRRWTIKLTFSDGDRAASGRFENRILRADEDGAVILTKFYGPDGKLMVAAKVAVSFTPEYEALLLPPPNAEHKGEETIKAAGKKWVCDAYTVKLPGDIDGEEFISRDYPGLRIKSSAMKNGRKVAFELTEFKD